MESERPRAWVASAMSCRASSGDISSCAITWTHKTQGIGLLSNERMCSPCICAGLTGHRKGWQILMRGRISKICRSRTCIRCIMAVRVDAMVV